MSWALTVSLASLLPLSLSVHSAPGSLTPSMLLENAKSKGFSLCLCLEHFFHTFPAFSFSSTDLRSNENYQRHFLTTPYKVPFSIFPLPLRIFSSEHFLPFLILHVCLLSLSHHKNVRSEDQGPLSGECDSEAGNSVMGWSLQGGSNCTLASCGFTEGS